MTPFTVCAFYAQNFSSPKNKAFSYFGRTENVLDSQNSASYSFSTMIFQEGWVHDEY
jgi:hypothetical protein